jgi:putative hydrolase of the HAD superfamily
VRTMQRHDGTITAVIFDWGGVLVEQPVPGLLAHFAQKLGVTPEELNTAFIPFAEAFQKGQISEHDLWEGIAAVLGVERPYNPTLWDDAIRAVYRPNEEMFALASLLKDRGYKVGLLSNTELPSVRFFHEQGYTQFDATVFSCEEGTSKPEQRIYEIALERLGVGTAEAVFIDDRADFVHGAQRLGMHTIRFESPEQVKGALVALSIPIE